MSNLIDTTMPSVKILEAVRSRLFDLERNIGEAMVWLKELINTKRELRMISESVEPHDDATQADIRGKELWALQAALELKNRYDKIDAIFTEMPELKAACATPVHRLLEDYADKFAAADKAVADLAAREKELADQQS